MNKHLKKFETHSDYEAYIEGDAVFPNVSVCGDNAVHVHYNTWRMPYNEIWYTTTDGNMLSKLNDPSWFGDDLELISHTYENGKGVLKFSGYPTRLGQYVFNEINLSEIWLPDTIEYIDGFAFSGSSLTSIDIPSSVYGIRENAFRDCSSLASITVDPNNTDYDSRDNCNAIIETDSDTLVVGCKNTVIPSSVTSIGHAAFCGRTSLTSIDIPSSVTSIEDNAFNGCTSLASIDIPSSVTFIATYAFYGCYFIESNFINNSSADGYPWGATIADEEIDGLLIEDNQVVAARPYITVVNIPEGVTSIADYAFEERFSLTSVTLPSTLTSIGDRAFRGCTFAESNFINNSSADGYPWGATIVDEEIDGLFIEDNQVVGIRHEITSANIPEGVTGIAYRAFDSCWSLNSVTLPSTLTSIGESAFCNCTSLGSIDIPSSVTSIEDDAFYNCSSLVSIDIPDGVTSIEYSTFGSCNSLVSVTLPSTLTSIGDHAFSYCYSLASIDIPSSVTSIGDEVFYCDFALVSITCLATTPPSLGRYAFDGTNDCPIYVPAASVNAYKTAAGWSEYASRIQAIS